MGPNQGFSVNWVPIIGSKYLVFNVLGPKHWVQIKDFQFIGFKKFGPKNSFQFIWTQNFGPDELFHLSGPKH